jgi:hypothetical protein
MQVSEKFVGKVVTVQLGRPLYIIDYFAHVRYGGDVTQIMGEVAMKGGQPLVMDVLIGARVMEVLADSIKVEMLSPGGHFVHKTVPSALILSIDEIVEFEPTDLPDVTTRVRQPEAQGPSKRIIL